MQTLGRAPLANVNVLDLLLDAICVVDAQGRFMFVSAAFERIFGYPPDEAIGRPMIELVHPDDRARTLAAVDEIVAGDAKPAFENRYVRKDGRVVHIMWSARWSDADQVRVAVARDITERKHAEQVQAALYALSEAAHVAEDLVTLFARVHRIIGTLLPAAHCFVALRDAATGQVSYPYHVDLPGTPAPPPGLPGADAPGAQAIRSGEPHQATPEGWLSVPLAAAESCIGALGVKRLAGDPPYTPGDVELLKFVSTQVASAIERKQAEARLRHSARHDPLTDLPNRHMVRDRLAVALERARRDHLGVALLYLDLDLFKEVNDRHGHAAGDALLQQVAQRLGACVRQSDTVGRMGGDEFVAVIAGLPAPARAHAASVAEKVRRALGEPFHLGAAGAIRISASIGMALFPEQAADAEALLGIADSAMYRAKRGGGNQLAWVVDPP